MREGVTQMDANQIDPDAKTLTVRYASPSLFAMAGEQALERLHHLKKNGRRNGVSFSQGNGRSWHLYQTATGYVIEHHGVLPPEDDS